MKKILSFIGIIFILIFVAYLESPTKAYHGFVPNYNDGLSEETEEVSAEVEEKELPETYSSLEYIKEGTKVEDGYKIVSYREYEIYKDEEGNVVKKVPTSNYDFLKYKIIDE